MKYLLLILILLAACMPAPVTERYEYVTYEVTLLDGTTEKITAHSCNVETVEDRLSSDFLFTCRNYTEERPLSGELVYSSLVTKVEKID